MKAYLYYYIKIVFFRNGVKRKRRARNVRKKNNQLLPVYRWVAYQKNGFLRYSLWAGRYFIDEPPALYAKLENLLADLKKYSDEREETNERMNKVRSGGRKESMATDREFGDGIVIKCIRVPKGDWWKDNAEQDH